MEVAVLHQVVRSAPHALHRERDEVQVKDIVPSHVEVKLEPSLTFKGTDKTTDYAIIAVTAVMLLVLCQGCLHHYQYHRLSNLLLGLSDSPPGSPIPRKRLKHHVDSKY